VVSKRCFIFAPAFASKTATSDKGSQKKFFEKSFQKIWWFEKFALPLHHFPASKNECLKVD